MEELEKYVGRLISILEYKILEIHRMSFDVFERLNSVTLNCWRKIEPMIIDLGREICFNILNLNKYPKVVLDIEPADTRRAHYSENVIHLNVYADIKALFHELKHFEQDVKYKDFRDRYTKEIKKYGYDFNIFEVEARRFSDWMYINRYILESYKSFGSIIENFLNLMKESYSMYIDSLKVYENVREIFYKIVKDIYLEDVHMIFKRVNDYFKVLFPMEFWLSRKIYDELHILIYNAKRIDVEEIRNDVFRYNALEYLVDWLKWLHIELDNVKLTLNEIIKNIRKIEELIYEQK